STTDGRVLQSLFMARLAPLPAERQREEARETRDVPIQSVRFRSQRIPARTARAAALPTMLQRGKDKKSPRHAAMPSHDRPAQAKRCAGRSSKAAKFVAAYQTSVQALAAGMSVRI